MAEFIKPNRDKTQAPNTKDNATKWSTGIEQQSKTPKKLNVQSIPTELIKIDPNNARSMLLTLEEINNAPKIGLMGAHDEIYVGQLRAYVSKTQDSERKLNELLKTADLAEKIRQSGLIHPITTFMVEMEFQLISGHRRLFASILLDEEEIASNIQERPKSDVDRYLIQWSENEDREDLKLSEQLKNIRIIIQSWELETDKKISITKLMELLGFKKTQASWYLKTIREMDDSPLYTKLINEDKISSLETSYRVSQVESIDMKARLLQKIDNSELDTYTQINDYLKSTVRSPNNNQKMVKKENKPNINNDIEFNAQLLKEIAKSNILSVNSNVFENLDLNSSKDLKKAWKLLYTSYYNKKSSK